MNNMKQTESEFEQWWKEEGCRFPPISIKAFAREAWMAAVPRIKPDPIQQKKQYNLICNLTAAFQWIFDVSSGEMIETRRWNKHYLEFARPITYCGKLLIIETVNRVMKEIESQWRVREGINFVDRGDNLVPFQIEEHYRQ